MNQYLLFDDDILHTIEQTAKERYKNNQTRFTQVAMHPETARKFERILDYEHVATPMSLSGLKFRWGVFEVIHDDDVPIGIVDLRI